MLQVPQVALLPPSMANRTMLPNKVTLLPEMVTLSASHATPTSTYVITVRARFEQKNMCGWVAGVQQAQIPPPPHKYPPNKAPTKNFRASLLGNMSNLHAADVSNFQWLSSAPSLPMYVDFQESTDSKCYSVPAPSRWKHNEPPDPWSRVFDGIP